jgi:hypothetical protein
LSVAHGRVNVHFSRLLGFRRSARAGARQIGEDRLLEFSSIKGFKDILPSEALTWQSSKRRQGRFSGPSASRRSCPPSGADRALQQEHRRGDGHCVQGNVFLHGQQGKEHEPQARSHGFPGQGLHPAPSLRKEPPFRSSLPSGPCSGTNGPRRAASGSSTRSTRKSSAIPDPSPMRKSSSWA